jgi:hypothetical protein
MMAGLDRPATSASEIVVSPELINRPSVEE